MLQYATFVTPGGQRLTLPAYYADLGLYAVHARPEEVGTYRFGSVSETTLGIHDGFERQPEDRGGWHRVKK